jgi:hypothetical protein
MERAFELGTVIHVMYPVEELGSHNRHSRNCQGINPDQLDDEATSEMREKIRSHNEGLDARIANVD